MTGWIVAGGILLLLALLLCAPVCANIVYDGEFTADVSYIFLKFRVFPAKPKDETKKKKKPKETKKKEPEEKETLGEKLEKLQKTVESVKELMAAAKGPLRLLLKSIALFRLELRIVIAGEDAAKTGESYGKLCAVTYPLAEQLRRIKRPWHEDISICPDFIRQDSSVNARAKLGIMPVSVIAAVIAFAFSYIGVSIKGNIQKTTARRNAALKRRTQEEQT